MPPSLSSSLHCSSGQKKLFDLKANNFPCCTSLFSPLFLPLITLAAITPNKLKPKICDAPASPPLYTTDPPPPPPPPSSVLLSTWRARNKTKSRCLVTAPVSVGVPQEEGEAGLHDTETTWGIQRTDREASEPVFNWPSLTNGAFSSHHPLLSSSFFSLRGVLRGKIIQLVTLPALIALLAGCLGAEGHQIQWEQDKGLWGLTYRSYSSITDESVRLSGSEVLLWIKM